MGTIARRRSEAGDLAPTSQRADPSWLQLSLCGLLLLGAGLRVWGCVKYAYVHADEYHQYLNPAWWRLTGLGIRAWEWREGARSWVFPWYNGGWLALFMQLGVTRGTTLVWLMRVHWALVNASMVYAGWRGAVAISLALDRTLPTAERDDSSAVLGGLLAAVLCALFPLLVIYSAHVLTELPSMLCLVWGMVLTSELVFASAEESVAARRKAMLAGFLLSLGACLRIANAPLILIAPAWLLFARQYRNVLALVVVALIPALVFGLIDAFTWSSFASSFRAYLEFNLIDGRAARFGTQPAAWYVQTLWSRAPWGLPLLLILGLAGLRVTWAHLLSAALAVAYLSTQAHKEERFILIVWPFLLIAASGSAGHWLARLRRERAKVATPSKAQRRSQLAPIGLAVVITSAVLWESAANMPEPDHAGGALMDCERWAGARGDTSGLILAVPWSSVAGALWYGLRVPVALFRPPLVRNGLFNYAIARHGSISDQSLANAGFRTVFESGGYLVRARTNEVPLPQP